MNSTTKDEIFSSWVSVIIDASELPIVKFSPDMVYSFFELHQLIPDKYGWRNYDIESFKKLIEYIRQFKKGKSKNSGYIFKDCNNSPCKARMG